MANQRLHCIWIVPDLSNPIAWYIGISRMLQASCISILTQATRPLAKRQFDLALRPTLINPLQSEHVSFLLLEKEKGCIYVDNLDIQADRQVGRQVDRQIDRQMGREREREREREKRERERSMDGWMDGWVDGWIDRWIDRQIDRKKDRQIDTWIDR